MNYPMLSLVIPVYNEARRLPPCLDECFAFLPRYIPTWELIIVDDGSTDATWEILEKYKKFFNHFNIIRNPHYGKGYTVKTGMLFANGEYRVFMDVDLSTPLTEIPSALQEIAHADIVIGSREIDRTKVQATLKRRIIGRIFHAFVTDLVPEIRDTQCGFKMFRDYAAKDIFGAQQINGWAFDVELLYLANAKGYTVREIPVAWSHNADSRVRVVGDSLAMLRDIASIPVRHRRTIERQTV